jgi:hypothetical protein
VKVKQVKEKKLGLEVDLQKVKVEQVKEQKLGFKSRSTKGKNRTCRKRIKEKHIS